MSNTTTLWESANWTLKIMDTEKLNDLHNRLRRKLGYDSGKPIDYDQLDPNDVQMYNIVDAELCTRRQSDPGKIALMLAEELIKSNKEPPENTGIGKSGNPNMGNGDQPSGVLR